MRTEGYIIMLQNIHRDYDGFGFSDNRLHENTDLIRGCGGVGIIWKKSLSVSPVTISLPEKGLY